MLHTEILKGKTLELLKRLMAEPQLGTFKLVDGTALSLYLGHRKSIDLDLFSKEQFDVGQLRKLLFEKYGFIERFSGRQTLKGGIDGVFIDCIQYDYRDISPMAVQDGIRIASIPDLLAMKFAAIINSGERKKDFVDVACFSTKTSMHEMLGACTAKYDGASPYAALKAILYFDDIKRTEPLVMTSGGYQWEFIEQRLKDMANNPDKVFSNLPTEQISPD